MAFPPSRGDRLVESVALAVIFEISLILIDAIVDGKIESAGYVGSHATVAVEPFDGRSVNASYTLV